MRKTSQNQHDIRVPFTVPFGNSAPFSTVRDFLSKTFRQSPPAEEVAITDIPPSRRKNRYHNRVRPKKRGKIAPASVSPKGPRIKQPYEVFLVLGIVN
jgi:hypothetical protein